MKAKLRVRAKMKECYNRKTDEHWNEMYQFLEEQQPYFFGLLKHWVLIDIEEVPNFAWIQSACLGNTDWKSKFKDIPNVEFIKHK